MAVDCQSLSHTKWECKYHVVFIPKYRKKICISNSNGFRRRTEAGYIKGKSSIYVARRYGEGQIYFSDEYMWVRGYFVSMVGLDEDVIRIYIREQEKKTADKMDNNS